MLCLSCSLYKIEMNRIVVYNNVYSIDKLMICTTILIIIMSKQKRQSNAGSYFWLDIISLYLVLIKEYIDIPLITWDVDINND